MNYLEILSKDIYYTESDLRYNKSLGFLMSQKELKNFLSFKEESAENGSNNFLELPLRSFNSKALFLNFHRELLDLYSEYLNLVHSEDIFSGSAEEMKRARIYSEIEGTLKIEGCNSTRALFDKLMAGYEPQNLNEIIIRNMTEGIRFVENIPSFTADNLFKLYSILSDNCLNEDQKLKPGEHYRYDDVIISSYNGAPPEEIEACMESLFDFVNQNLRSLDPVLRFLLPHIVHYYMLYVHPYFDYNGRTARMCSLWVASLIGLSSSPYFISEAINDQKKEYYKAISNSRDSKNDLTYFLIYILKTSIRYALCYRQLRIMSEQVKLEGDKLTEKELTYLKKIFLNGKDSYFTWKDFLDFISSDMSKQGALKFLNAFEKMNLIESKINSKREKVFRIIIK